MRPSRGICAPAREPAPHRARALARHARDLVLGRGRGDVRIEAAARAVTRSTGTGRVLPGSAARSAAMRSRTAVASAGFVGPWFEPLEAAPL